jgi:hypothetical protein
MRCFAALASAPATAGALPAVGRAQTETTLYDLVHANQGPNFDLL